MGKRIVTLCMVLILMFHVQMTVCADGVFEYKVSDGAVAIAKYKGISEQVEIPSKTADGKVTAILSEAFKGNKEMKSIVIPESIVRIERKAFEGCQNLKDVYYSGTAENWDKINIEEKGNTSFIKAEVHFGKTDGSILENEFFRYRINSGNEITVSKCKAKYAEDTKITFPAWIDEMKVVGIEDNAFENCRNVTEIRLEDGIKYIGARAFANCVELKRVKLPNSLERIGSHAFTDTEIYKNSPDGSIYIDGWYCGYKGDTSKEIDIRIQRNTKGIADFAFYKNENMVNTFFTKGVKYIGSGAFSECQRLSGIFFEGTKKDWAEIEIASGNESLSESKMRYNTTIDNYEVNIYKGLSMTLLVITGIQLAFLVYCIAKITDQKQKILQLEKRKSVRSAGRKPSSDAEKPPVRRKKTSTPKKKD